jgi:acetyltransferase
VLRDGRTVRLRPIRPGDLEAEREFIRGLSPQSSYLRFFAAMPDPPASLLERFTRVDFGREMALVALADRPDGGERQIGVARYHVSPQTRTGEFAIVVADDWQGSGVARALRQLLIESARVRHRLDALTGDALAGNERMIGLARALGFEVGAHPDDAKLVRLHLPLGRHAAHDSPPGSPAA